jgi:esterase FrsA
VTVNDVDELKQFIVVHARAQGLAPAATAALLARVETDDRDGAGSWVGEWSAEAEALAGRGRLLDAARHFNIARFPYVDGPARQRALDRCVAAFDAWRAENDAVQRLDVEVDGKSVRCYASGLSAAAPKPVLLVLGGIVSIKEQWAPVLLQARRLGMAGLVAEMPGVGENPLPYTPDSWRLLPALLDAVADRADVARTYAVTLSFSGHLALRACIEDNRIRGIATAGAPVHAFFTDRTWQRSLPRVTVDTLAHLAGTTPGRLPERLGDWALTPAQLSAVDIPVGYLASRRDEIIPAADVRLLAEHVRDFRPVSYDDVHGAPRHTAESRLWAVRSVLQLRGVHNLQRAAVATAWHGLRAKNKLRRST